MQDLGVGLGPSFARRRVQRHGGSLRCSAVDGVAVNSCLVRNSCPYNRRDLRKVDVVIGEACLSVLCVGSYQVDVHECR